MGWWWFEATDFREAVRGVSAAFRLNIIAAAGELLARAVIQHQIARAVPAPGKLLEEWEGVGEDRRRSHCESKDHAQRQGCES
jgi:hypothetical protein